MSDHDELISQFKDVTGTSDDRAQFYLDSSNWVLHLAISSFYENQQEVNNILDEDHTANVETVSASVGSRTNAEAQATGSQPETPLLESHSSNWSKKSIKPKVATLHNMPEQCSDDEEEGQAFYAGGSERSGQQVLGPPKRKNFREQLTDMFKMAHDSGAVVDSHMQQPSTSNRGSNSWGIGLRLGQSANDHEIVTGERPTIHLPTLDPVILKLWSQGFSINDGELRPYDDPENKEFLETVMKGQIPNELRQMGNMVSVDVEDHRHEDFKKSANKVKIFKGSGHTLGSPAPEVQSIATIQAASSNNNVSQQENLLDTTQQLYINENEPTTMLQIRLSDGSRIAGQFNLSHTINDIRQYIINCRPQYANQNFTLVTSFPTKELSEGSDSIDAAGLKNASLMQRLL